MYLQTPKVFQSLMVLSLEPETIWRLSEEKATLRTSLVWPTKRRVVVPLREGGDSRIPPRRGKKIQIHSKNPSLRPPPKSQPPSSPKIQIFEGKRRVVYKRIRSDGSLSPSQEELGRIGGIGMSLIPWARLAL